MTEAVAMRDRRIERSHKKSYVRETKVGEEERVSEKMNQPSRNDLRRSQWCFGMFFTRSMSNSLSRTVLCFFGISWWWREAIGGHTCDNTWRSIEARAVFRWLHSVVFCAVVTPCECILFSDNVFSFCLIFLCTV